MNQMNQVKLIDANDFYENLLEQAITDDDRRFCEKVKFALDKQNEVTILIPYNFCPKCGEKKVNTPLTD